MNASTLPVPTEAPAVAAPRPGRSGTGTAIAPVAAPTTSPAHMAPAVPTAPRRAARAAVRRARDDDRGQATAEYGLVILVAGLIALGVIAWVRDSSVFTDMFNNIIETLTSSV